MDTLLNAAELVLAPNLEGRRGEDTALIAPEGRIDFAALARRVNRAGNALAGLGVGRGDRVLFLMADTPAFMAAYLGALKLGAVAVALNTRTSGPALGFVIADSAARLLLVDRALIETAAPAAQGALKIAACGGGGEGAADWDALEAAASDVMASAPTAAADPAFWIYSSGTTGDPKAIVHTHKDAVPVGRVLDHVLGLRRGDRVFATSKLFFAYAMDNAFLGALRLGAPVVLHPDWPDPADAIAIVARHRPAAMFSVPSFYRRLLAEPAERLAALRSVAYFMSGGEAVPAALDARWRAATGRPLLQAYGTSETFCVAIATEPGEAPAGSAGRPLPGVRARLLDESGAELPPGVPGVLWLAHPALAAGYWHRPEATAAVFRDGWFNTKDRFSCDRDGFWYFQGRADEMLKIAGQWVAPSEVEEVLMRAAGVKEAACVPVPDEDGLARLAAFVVAETGAAPAAVEEAVRAVCARQLARYKHPRWLRFVAEMPRTASGKLQRFRLREALLEERKGARR